MTPIWYWFYILVISLSARSRHASRGILVVGQVSMHHAQLWCVYWPYYPVSLSLVYNAFWGCWRKIFSFTYCVLVIGKNVWWQIFVEDYLFCERLATVCLVLAFLLPMVPLWGHHSHRFFVPCIHNLYFL